VLTKTGDNSNTLFSERYQQTYHSTFGAHTESMHVFLHGTGVVQRLQAGQTTRILEIGLGLGLNCLLSADCASTAKTDMHYTAIEHDLISGDQLRSLDYQKWLQNASLVDALAGLLDSSAKGKKAEAASTHKQTNSPGELQTAGRYAILGRHTTLQLHLADATSDHLLNSLDKEAPYHAIFLDAFSPDFNAECWTERFFHRLRPLLATDGVLATYCVKGEVRRNLQSAGFIVEKVPGPTGKREVLRAVGKQSLRIEQFSA